MIPQKFEAFNLQRLCDDFNPEIGSQYFDYLVDDILSCELENSARGMDYSLVKLDYIIEAMKVRIENQGESSEFEDSLLTYLKKFSTTQDINVLVWISGW